MSLGRDGGEYLRYGWVVKLPCGGCVSRYVSLKASCLAPVIGMEAPNTPSLSFAP